MILVVEDGSGLPDANSYCSISFAEEYLSTYVSYARSFFEARESIKEASLARGTEYLDITFNGRWSGLKTSKEQGLAFPRRNVWMSSLSAYYPSSTVPTTIKRATAFAAFVSLEDPTLFETGSMLQSSSIQGATIKSEFVKLGDIERRVDYLGGKVETTFTGKTNLLDKIHQLVLEFLETGFFMERG